MIEFARRKQHVRESLEFWNPWWHGEERKCGITRKEYLDEARKLLSMKEVLVIQGIRRSGKSTLMLQIIRTLLQEIPKENICYLNFDDNVLHPYLDDPDFPDTLLEVYQEKKGPKGRVYLFLDEIQNLNNWHLWVKKIHDRELDVKFVLTGSSSHLLGKEYASLLTGRTLIMEIFPLSFKEFLHFKKIECTIDGGSLITRRPELNRLLNEFLKFGGFPEVVLHESDDGKIRLLKEYYSGIIARDIFMRYRLRNGKTIENTANYLLSNSSNLTSMKRLAGFVGSSPHTLQDHIAILTDVYMLFFIPFFSYSHGQQMRFSKKCYTIDTGLVNAVSFRFSENRGRTAENAVCIHLLRKGVEIFYWKDKKGREVDFVVKEGTDVVVLLQVCQFWSDDVMRRETQALIAAMKHFDLKEATVITEDHSGEIESDAGMIRFVPLYIWLLESS